MLALLLQAAGSRLTSVSKTGAVTLTIVYKEMGNSSVTIQASPEDLIGVSNLKLPDYSPCYMSTTMGCPSQTYAIANSVELLIRCCIQNVTCVQLIM